MAAIFDSVDITPAAIAAGDSDTITITLVIGAGYAPGPTRILFDMPATLGMSRPNLLHAEEPGFVRVFVDNPRVTWTRDVWDIEGQRLIAPDHQSYRGMAARIFVLGLSGGLDAGDRVRVVFGDGMNGYGTGWKAATVVPKTPWDAEIHLRYFADPEGGLPDLARDIPGTPRPVPDHEERLTFRITPREPRSVRVLRSPKRTLILPLDRFANIAEVDSREALAAMVAMEDPGDAAVARTEAGTFAAPSPTVTVRALPEGVAGRLPVSDAPTMHDVHQGYNLYWGDIHTHSRFSNDCIEREKQQMTPADLMLYVRQRAGLDFYAVTDHHQPWDVARNKIGADLWEATVAAARAASAPGDFLGLVGFEYRCPRGDTAIVFADYPEYAAIDQPAWTDVRKLWDGLARREVLSIPHYHNAGRLEEGTWYDGPGDLEPVQEIFSCHGSFEMETALEHLPALCKRRRPDRNGLWMLERGLKLGLCANSDGHKGHVGTNGVTAVFAKELTPEAIFEAYRARRVYATTNARIRLVFTGNGALMGAVVANTRSKRFAIDVTGEGRLKKVELIGNGVARALFEPEGGADGRRFTIEHVIEDAAPGYWYVRATQRDNHVAWSSPIWFE